MMGLPPQLSGNSQTLRSPHPKFRRLWSLAAPQGLQEHLTTPELRQAGGKEEEREMGERKTAVNVAGSADSQRPQKQVGSGVRRLGASLRKGTTPKRPWSP